ncbi:MULTISPECIES: hypothetical protein [unclassified Rhodococcus (in: high G+C Gram-positive bacteria)]|uniref:hypothetical protein n=1 Tax=Rhodococcus sp. SJ-3 TaxID=3454628 RepID=UPI003F795B4E
MARAHGVVLTDIVTNLTKAGMPVTRGCTLVGIARFPVVWRIEYNEEKVEAVEMFTDAFTAFGLLLDASLRRVSDDNPLSESLFETITYALTCPARFDDIARARR